MTQTPSPTKTHTVETDFGSIELRRLSFREMREHGALVEQLFDADTSGQVLYSEGFEQLMELACASEEDFARLFDECDQNAVWEVWTSYCEFARFEDFFAEASAQQQRRKLGLMERRAQGMREQLDRMKKSGLVPEDFSMDTVVNNAMKEATTSPETSASGDSTPKGKTEKGTSKKR